MNPRDPKAFTQNFALDYFRRPGPFRRWKVTLSLAAALICAGAVAAFVAVPQWRTVFQSGPVSNCHSQFGVTCAACHDQPFATARRLLPGDPASSVSDERCISCHSKQAGRHDPHQLANTGPDGKMAANCSSCHAEHRGEKLNRIPDSTCVACHGDLKTDGPAHYAASIHHFATDHPKFGEWREKLGRKLEDPAGDVFHFDHAYHMNLPENYAAVSPERKAIIANGLAQIRERGCAACHVSDEAGNNMKPVRYRDHCASCHPLRVQPTGSWPDEVIAKFTSELLPHPGPGENASSVWAVLLNRYLRMSKLALPTPEDGPVQPPVLRRSEDPKAAEEKLAQERTQVTAAQLFLPRAGCLLCHSELTKPDNRPQGIPEIANPRQFDTRWNDDRGNYPAARLMHPAYSDARNRWFPLAQFRHASHGTMSCTECHPALGSKTPGDLLMPTLASCQKCHNTSPTAARSDCLTCHRYHDRSQETPGRLQAQLLVTDARP